MRRATTGGSFHSITMKWISTFRSAPEPRSVPERDGRHDSGTVAGGSTHPRKFVLLFVHAASSGGLQLLRSFRTRGIHSPWRSHRQAAAAPGAVGLPRCRGFGMNVCSQLSGTFERPHAQSEFPETGIGFANVQESWRAMVVASELSRRRSCLHPFHVQRDARGPAAQRP